MTEVRSQKSEVRRRMTDGIVQKIESRNQKSEFKDRSACRSIAEFDDLIAVEVERHRRTFIHGRLAALMGGIHKDKMSPDAYLIADHAA